MNKRQRKKRGVVIGRIWVESVQRVLWQKIALETLLHGPSKYRVTYDAERKKIVVNSEEAVNANDERV